MASNLAKTDNVTGSQPQTSKRKSLADGFEEACLRFKAEISNPLVRKDYKRADAAQEFLRGMQLDKLEQLCSDLSSQAEVKANNAAKLWSTLDQFKSAGDAFMESAPESVSIIWFGISSLITVGNAGVQTKLLICGTCDSIANIVADCIRWEARVNLISKEIESAKQPTMDEPPTFEIWDTDIPELIFSILDFLWHARPHIDQSRLKRLGSSLKDLFTKELQQKVDSLLEKYEGIVKLAQANFEDSVLYESLKTGTNIDQIRENLNSYVSTGKDIIDAVRRQGYIHELDRLKTTLSSNADAHKNHFASLNDRFESILKTRNGRLVSKWLFQDTIYQDWKSDNNDTTFLCLRGPRGHGKSVTMISAHRELTNAYDTAINDIKASGNFNSNLRAPLVCYFFFKKSEQDIELVRSALESILQQLLGSSQVRRDFDSLAAVVEILNPDFGESGSKGSGIDFLANQTSLCETIKKVIEVIPTRVYLMFDALDECLDRKEQELAQALRSLVQTTDRLRVIISARDSIDIASELADPSVGDQKPAGPNDDTKRVENLGTLLPANIKFIEITAKKNSSDLIDYLTYDVGLVLVRRINKEKFSSLFNQELDRIVKILHQKAKGDFTLARMVISTLKQPSKDSLETNIKRLSSAIGDIYMGSLESLTPEEQELVVKTLKWVVWAVSGVTVIEISDHYRELYYEEAKNHDLTGHHTSETQGISQETLDATAELAKLIDVNPYEDPEIKDIIYHLENAGRDFFRFDRNSGVVGVDISIREWIQEDSGSKSTTKESRGFSKFRDVKGNTVFNFSLTHCIVGDSKQHRRYEIDHWQDHIRKLQKWWDNPNRTDSWWSELLKQLSIFMRPENWYRWNLQRYYVRSKHSRQGISHDYEELMVRLYDEPIHLVSTFGFENIAPYSMFDWMRMLPALDEPLRIAWVADRTLSKTGVERDAAVEELWRKYGSVEDWRWREGLKDQVDCFLQEYDNDEIRIAQRLQELIAIHPKTFVMFGFGENHGAYHGGVGYYSFSYKRAGRPFEGHICDKPNPLGLLPVHLAGPYPETVKRLIGHGADLNILATRNYRGEEVSRNEQPLLSILLDLLPLEPEDELAQQLLESAKLMISNGANVDVKTPDGITPIHLAASIQDLRFFKLLCVSGDWDIHATGGEKKMTPMNFLFAKRPKEPEKRRCWFGWVLIALNWQEGIVSRQLIGTWHYIEWVSTLVKWTKMIVQLHCTSQ
ncbi:hypothetical protein ABW20_dc0108053 [Dactylellina cionopaga]|nr:hypothetical protein ABW20_dc0108053 [Dactylellina cionopaga]